MAITLATGLYAAMSWDVYKVRFSSSLFFDFEDMHLNYSSFTFDTLDGTEVKCIYSGVNRAKTRNPHVFCCLLAVLVLSSGFLRNMAAVCSLAVQVGIR